jgi:hypothetical protein
MSETAAQRAARIKDTLDTGVASTTVDGASTTLKHETLYRQLIRAEREAGIRKRRPRMINVQMGRR